MTKLLTSSVLFTLSAVAKGSRFGNADAACQTFSADTGMAGGNAPSCYPLVSTLEEKMGRVCVETESFLPDEARDMLKVTFDTTASSGWYLSSMQAQVGEAAADNDDTSYFLAHEALGESDAAQTFSLYIPLDRIQGQCCYGSEYDEKVWNLLSQATLFRQGEEEGVITVSAPDTATFSTTCHFDERLENDAILLSSSQLLRQNASSLSMLLNDNTVVGAAAREENSTMTLTAVHLPASVV